MSTASRKQSIQRRVVPEGFMAWPETVHPVLQRVYAARGISTPLEAEHRLARLLTPALLGGVPKAVELLIEAIQNDKTIMVAGDYDCDGATGAAVAVRGLRMLGAKHVRFIVPDRAVHGYGLSVGLVEAMQPVPDVIVTVDSGVSSVDGVRVAKAKGITVVITDHHLPGDKLPDADAIVNPNLVGDGFPSKALAGVGVMFYLLIALRAGMRERDLWVNRKEPDLTSLLDLVALGTIADLVALDYNNRIIVDAGLRRIRAGRGHAGVQALVAISGRDITNLAASDIAFSVAPRLNAAGRLENMSLGVETLITDVPEEAEAFAKQLDAINQDRRERQQGMIEEAENMVAQMENNAAVGVVVFDPSWHAGIVGLVASKLKENLHRPVIAFAPASEGSEEVRGSGRSIPGFHLRDALALIDARHPGLMPKFGGHAMAAGLSLKVADIPAFAKAFDEVATAALDAERLQAVIYSDGELPAGSITLDMAWRIRTGGPWGQGFPEPIFDNVFNLVDYRLMGEKHLKLFLMDPRDGTEVEAVFFNGYTGEALPLQMRLAYELAINEWKGKQTLQLMVRHMEPV